MKGGSTEIKKYAVVIFTEDGIKGEYVTHWCASDPMHLLNLVC